MSDHMSGIRHNDHGRVDGGALQNRLRSTHWFHAPPNGEKTFISRQSTVTGVDNNARQGEISAVWSDSN
jgi:hypothetical protein